MRGLVILCLSLLLSGCILDRFWTRDDTPSRHERLARLGLIDPETTPTEERYKYHFNLWRVWTSDLEEQLLNPDKINSLRKNRKRALKMAVESHKQLNHMRDLLLHDRQALLDPHVAYMDEIIEMLTGFPRGIQLRKLSKDLTRQRRRIDIEFRFSKVRDFIHRTSAFKTTAYEDDEDTDE